MKKFEDDTQNFSEVVDEAVIQFQVFEKLFGNFAKTVFGILGFCHFLEVNH